jgi:phosphoglycerate dehydrogenase-like enzyme
VAPDRELAAAEGVWLCSPGELIGAADFLSLHCPVVPETRGLVDDRFLDAMKPGAFLINTARGELVDKHCLLAALRSCRLRGAAVDVNSHEPPGADHPLMALPQVIATPHLASTTGGATNAMGRMALADCLAVLRGDSPRHPVF